MKNVLKDVRFGDNAGVVTYAGSTYVAFDDKNLYYNVTAKESREQRGIVMEEVIRKDGCLMVKPWCDSGTSLSRWFGCLCDGGSSVIVADVTRPM